MMLWYLLQLTIIVLVTNFYVSINTHQPLMVIIFIAGFLAYATTWIISSLLDLLTWAWRLCLPRHKGEPRMGSKNTSTGRIEVTHHTLPRH